MELLSRLLKFCGIAHSVGEPDRKGRGTAAQLCDWCILKNQISPRCSNEQQGERIKEVQLECGRGLKQHLLRSKCEMQSNTDQLLEKLLCKHTRNIFEETHWFWRHRRSWGQLASLNSATGLSTTPLTTPTVPCLKTSPDNHGRNSKCFIQLGTQCCFQWKEIAREIPELWSTSFTLFVGNPTAPRRGSCCGHFPSHHHPNVAGATVAWEGTALYAWLTWWRPCWN